MPYIYFQNAFRILPEVIEHFKENGLYFEQLEREFVLHLIIDDPIVPIMDVKIGADGKHYHSFSKTRFIFSGKAD